MGITEERLDRVPWAELLSQARNGETEAFCELARACEQRLYQQAVALCRDPATAEDLVVETLAEAWKSLPRFNDTCRFSTWLYAILLHRFQKLARKARSQPLALASLRPAEGIEPETLLERSTDAQPLPAEALVQKELTAQLHEAVDLLPRKHRQVVLLRFYQGASLPEIAGALGLSVGTVKSRLHHALEKLRRMKTVLNLSDQRGDT